MPLPKNRTLYLGGGATGKSTKVKSANRKRGKLRAATMVKSGKTSNLSCCCKCMYDSDRCMAIKKSNSKQCNYCAVNGKKFCSVHLNSSSRAGVLKKSKK